MTTIGSYEAKTKFSELIERAAEGEAFIITRHGKAAAKLSPLSVRGEEERISAIEALDDIRGHAVLGVDIAEARQEGRL